MDIAIGTQLDRIIIIAITIIVNFLIFFTDFFTLLKVEGNWRVINKVFHLHS